MAEKSNAINKVALDQMRERHALIFNQLSDTSLSANKLSVAAFKRDFLPYLSGQMALTDLAIQAWLNVAGDKFKSVLLVGENGEPVIEVPPLSVNTYFDPFRLDRNKTADPGALADIRLAKSQLAPNLAETNYQNGLVQRFRPTKTPVDKKILDKWQALFEYFGVLPKTKEDSSTTEPDAQTAPTLSYDNDDY